MLLVFMDLWDIVDRSKDTPHSNKECQMHIKNAMSIIGLSVVDNQLAFMKSCRGPPEAWKTFCNIHEMKSLSHMLFICCKFFNCKMEDSKNLLDNVNKIKAFAYHLVYLEVSVRDVDIVMTLI